MSSAWAPIVALPQGANFILFLIGLLGLAVGSFLNVVIVRVPRMLQNAWQLECLAEPPAGLTSISTSFNLLHPRSQCPQCQQSIAWFDNIPLFSFLRLRGRCRHCQQKISLRYPLVELLTSLLSVIVVLRFGISPIAFAGILLTWGLIALSFIDIDHTLLPDDITLPFLWLGLVLGVFEIFQTANASILGAVAGYLSLFTVFLVFKWITHKEGMGNGDFKMLAMLGAWFGWQSLPLIIFISSSLGSLVGISLMLLQGRDKDYPIPFGPFLAIGGFIALLCGPDYFFKFFNL